MKRLLLLFILFFSLAFLYSCDAEDVQKNEESSSSGTIESTISGTTDVTEPVVSGSVTEEANPCVHDFAKATCKAPKTCTLCGVTDGEPLEHSWKGPFCNLPVHCSVCGYSESEELGEHEWSHPNCTYPKTCHYCGLTEGEPNDEHSWFMAPCIKVNMCSICYKTDGESKGEHIWIEASCSSPKLCTECMITEGEPTFEHKWIEADCGNPKRCTSCGKTEGEPTGKHEWVEANCCKPKICVICNTTVGEPSGEHIFVPASCTVPKHCYQCGYEDGTELDPDNHNWIEADCAPKRCTGCHLRVGESAGLPHEFSGGGCKTKQTCVRCREEGDYVHKFGFYQGESNLCHFCGLLTDSKGLTFASYGNGYQVTGRGSCTDKHIKIPETYNGKPVVSIKSRAFNGDTFELTLPKTVTHIGNLALGFCDKIHYEGSLVDWANIKKDHKVTYMSWWEGEQPFDDITGFSSGPYKLYIDGKLLETLVIPESMTVIPDYAFASIEVKSVVLHDKITKIGNGAFVNMSCDIDVQEPLEEWKHLEFILPSSVKEIGDFAFCYASISTMLIPDSVEKVGAYALYNLTGHNSAIFCENASKPEGWNKNWIGFSQFNIQPYWKGSWEYVDGKPMIITRF